MQTTKASILNEAERLFAETGFHGASTRLIAKRADANLALITYYFKSKQGLFEAVIDQRANALNERLRRVTEGPDDSRERLRRFIDTLAQFLVGEHPLFARLLVREGFAGSGGSQAVLVDAAMRPHRELFQRILARGRLIGDFRYFDADLCFCAVLGVIGLASERSGGAAAGDQTRRLTDFLLDLMDRTVNRSAVAVDRANASIAEEPFVAYEPSPPSEPLTFGEID